MIGWFRRFAREWRTEYDRVTSERIPSERIALPQLDIPSSQQPIQTAVDMIVWRARGCGLNGVEDGHTVFDEHCAACWQFTHCVDHDEFDGECKRCRAMKDPQMLGTVSHWHADPTKRVTEAQLGHGRVVWND